MQRRAGVALAVAALPAAVCAAAAAALGDWRYVVVALMLVMVAYPGLAAVAWLSMAASPSVALKIRPQTWTFGADAVRIDYYPPGSDDDAPAADTSLLPFARIRKFEVRGKYAYFYTAVPTFRASGEYYIVPASLLPAATVRQLTEQLYDTEL